MDWTQFCDTEIRYFKLFLPIVIEMVSVMLTSTITTFYSAKIGDDYIVTGVGIATLLNIGVLYGFILGYGTVFDSYAGTVKASNGDGALGGLVVKCSIQGFIIYLLSLFPYAWCGYLVHLFGDDERVHDVALLYMKLECARPILLYLRDLLVKYLVVQGFPLTSLLIAVLALPTHLILGWFCVVHMEWGLYGLAGAQIGNSTLFVLILVLVCLWKRYELKWEIPCNSLTSGWGEMLKLGCFSGLRVTATYGLLISSHIFSQSSGIITAEAVVVLDKITLPFFASIFAGGYAVAMLIGQALGNADKNRYKYIIKLGLLNWVVERCITIVIYIFTMISLAKLFTENEEVLKEMRSAIPAMGAMLVVAALDELLARGILTPLGKQVFVGLATMVSIYLIGIPLMVGLIFILRAKASSIFWCFVVSNVVQCVAYLVRIYSINIDKEMDECRDRTSHQQSEISETVPLSHRSINHNDKPME